ncbi:hypothetical protein JCM10207_000602 [Rhodosporidiobolus poonsookiae]
MLATAAALDSLIRHATADPHFDLPQVVFMAATSDDGALYSGKGGWASVPDYPATKEQVAAEGVRIEEDSIFDLHSCTKLVAAVAAMQLIEQGTMALEDDASKFVPELKDAKRFVGLKEDGTIEYEENSTPVTVKMLLTQTSGFCYFFLEPRLVEVAKSLGVGPLPNHADATKEWLTKMPLVQKPGEHWTYGTSIDWLTLVIEGASGLSIEEYFQKNIFQPLGITDISYHETDQQIPMSLAVKEMFSFEPVAPGTPWTRRKATPFTGHHDFGGSGLKGSPRSYLRFLRAILRGGELDGARILRPETVDLMFRPHLETNQQRNDLRAFLTPTIDPFTRKAGETFPGQDYGYGGAYYGSSLPSGRGWPAMSWSGMANTYWVIDRGNDVAFVVFTNCLPFADQRVFDFWERAEVELYKGLKDCA